jgi:hypothetical protein
MLRTARIARLATASLFVASSILACSGESATGPETSLTKVEVEDAMDALNAVGGLALNFLPSVRVAGGSAAATENVNQSFACPEGGTTRLVGTVQTNEATESASADLRQQYTNCAVESSSGRVWTFNGDPDVRTTLNLGVILSSQTVGITGTQKGAFRFVSGQASGRCTIDIRVTVTETTYRVSGKVCGESVSATSSFEVG